MKLTCEQALNRLAAYCGRGERCLYDLRSRMTRWELSESDQQRIIQRLTQERFVDEERYCRAFVRDKFRYSHWGIHKIRYALKKKQLPESLIQAAVSELDPQSTREELRRLLAQKRKTIKDGDEFAIRQKLLRFAIGRGFDYEMALGLL